MDAVFSGSVIAMGGGVIFSALLGWACVSDLRTRRIPNRLVAVLAIGGLLFSLFAQRGGVPSAVAGLLVGFALWFPVYVLGALGAGDVKLFAAAAAWLGPRGAIEAAVLAAVAGGVLAVVMIASAGTVRETLRTLMLRLTTRSLRPAERVSAARDPRQLPYGIALAAGALLAGWLPTIAW